MTITIERAPITHLRHTVRLLDVQAREGKIKWQGGDGVLRTGHLWRGVRNARWLTVKDADPRDGYVLITDLDRTDHLILFNDLVSLYDQGRVQVLR